MKYQAVIFDLFGTLVRNFSTKEYQEVLAQMAEAISVSASDFIKHWYGAARERNTGTGGLQSIQDSVRHIGKVLGHDVSDSQMEQAIKARLDYIKWMLTPRPGVSETISYLKSKSCKIGLLSDSSIEIPLVWERTPLACQFDVAVFSCLVGLKKPDPKIYELACERLNVPAGNCLFIGDGGSRELSGAAKAGMHPVMIEAYGKAELPQSNSEAADWTGPVISSLEEVKGLIE